MSYVKISDDAKKWFSEHKGEIWRGIKIAPPCVNCKYGQEGGKCVETGIPIRKIPISKKDSSTICLKYKPKEE